MVFAQELHLRNYNYWIIGLTKLLFFRWLKCLNYSIFVSNSDTTADNLRNEPSEVNRDIYEKFRFENQFESSLIRFRPLEYGPLLCFSLNQSHPDRLKEWKKVWNLLKLVRWTLERCESGPISGMRLRYINLYVLW